MKIAYFVTPHGFGHAARSAAVMLALRRIAPQVEFEVFTTVPQWFFRDSLGEGFGYNCFTSDIGLVQKTPFNEDLPATIATLNQSQLTAHRQISNAGKLLRDQKCQLVVCDISPLGIEVAHNAGLPAVLVENFTWDFIYSGYLDSESGFASHVQRLKLIFRQADLHIQAAPVCQLDPSSILVEPVARTPLTPREEVRKRLGLNLSERVVLVTMGGIEEKYSARNALQQLSETIFVLPGTTDRLIRDQNLILLPHHNDFYHPDLVHACDAVIGKLGYSTVAEVYHAGVPFAYIPRPAFPETLSMVAFAQKEMAAMELSYPDFLEGRWEDLPERLLATPIKKQHSVNGADQIAAAILERYS